MIKKRWFEELGKYDLDMDIWGGENLGLQILSLLPKRKLGLIFFSLLYFPVLF